MECGLARVETKVLFGAGKRLIDRERPAVLRLKPGRFIVGATAGKAIRRRRLSFHLQRVDQDSLARP